MHIKELLEDYDQFVEKVLTKMDSTYHQKDKTFIDKAKKDIWYSLLFVSEGVTLKEPQIIKEYFFWLHSLFVGLGFKDNTAYSLFEYMKEELSSILEKDEVEFLENIIIDKLLETKQYVKKYTSEKDQYVEYLLKHDRAGSNLFVKELIEQKFKIADIYMYIFQEAMYDIGALWHERKIGVADEHYATMVTQFNITSLYPYIFNTKKNGYKMLATAIGSELHEMGIRMVADMFEMHGWKTFYLGANIPVEEVVTFIKENSPDLIALSTTMSLHLSTLKEAIDIIKSLYPDIKIIVGGLPFIDNPTLYKKLNADGTALNGLQAVELGVKLVS